MSPTPVSPEYGRELEVMFKELSPRVHNYARAISLGNEERASDLTMEAAAAAVESWSVLREQEDPDVQAMWLIGVVHRRHIDALRRDATASRFQGELWLSRPPDPAGPEAIAELRALVENFNQAIARMPPQRQAVARCKWHRWLTNAEIAAEMDISVGAVSAHVTAARSNLRYVLAGHRADPIVLLEGGTGV